MEKIRKRNSFLCEGKFKIFVTIDWKVFLKITSVSKLNYFKRKKKLEQKRKTTASNQLRRILREVGKRRQHKITTIKKVIHY